MENSEEVGERAVWLSIATILLHDLQKPVIGDANEDCVRKAGPIRVHSKPFFSSDCAVEAGYQVADIGACDLLDRAWLVCRNWRFY